MQQGAVVLTQYVGQIEVGCYHSLLLRLLPVDCDAGHHLIAPLLVNSGEVVLIDSHLADVATPHDEVVAYKLAQFSVVNSITLDERFRLQYVRHLTQYVVELLGLVV